MANTSINQSMSVGAKVVAGGLGLALLGGLFTAFGSGKKPAAVKLSGAAPRKPCGCGR